MATYMVNGQKYKLPDGLPDDQAYALIQQDMGSQTAPATQAAGGANPPPATPSTTAQPKAAPVDPLPQLGEDVKFDPTMLQFNNDFISASKTLYEFNHKAQVAKDKEMKVPPKDNVFYQEYGRDQVGWSYNTAMFGVDAARMNSAPIEVLKAYHTLLDYGDHFEWSKGGVKRGLLAIATDPTNLIGLETLGVSTVLGQGAKFATKAGLKAMLRKAIITGVEGSAVVAANDAIRQSVDIGAGAQKEFDYGRLGKAGAIGAAGGVILGGAVQGAGQIIKGIGKDAGKAAEAPVAREATTLADEAVPPAGEPARGPAVDPATPVPPAATQPAAPQFIRQADLVTRDANGVANVDMKQAADTVTSRVQQALDDGHTVIYHIEGKEVPIVKIDNGMMADAKGQRWGIADILSPKPGDDVRVELRPASEVHPHDVPLGTSGKSINDVVAAIKEAAGDTGGRIFLRSAEEIDGKSAKPVETLMGITKHDINRITEEVRREGFGPEETQVMKATLVRAYENLENSYQELYKNWKAMPKGAARDAVKAELDKAKQVKDTVRSADLEISSGTGSELQDRNNKLNTGDFRKVSEDSILRDMGVEPELATPEQRIQAEDKFNEAYWKAKEARAATKAEMDLTDKISEAHIAGDTAEAIKLTHDLAALRDAKIAREGGAKSTGLLHDIMNHITTWVISTVFTPATVIRNTLPSLLKTIYRPALDFLVKGPFDMANYKAMVAQYSTIATHMDFAMRGAKVAWQMERGLINTEFNKALETEMRQAFRGRALGKFGLVLRTFPRILGATDELFAQLNYRGFVASQFAGDAYRFGIAKGLKGAELDAFVKAKIASGLETSFGEVNAPKVLALLRQRGLDMGLPAGPKLDAWMKTMMDKNKDLFREALNQSGKDYADDVLFKRAFSGENRASELAKDYERFVNKNPMMRIMGQLFFRTPVRVFEEGIRLTAGVNLFAGLVTGTFIKDLRGVKGPAAQLRAQGELMLSYAIAMGVFSLYANGKLTGGGPTDWRQRRQTEDAKTWKPYTMQLGDGQEFSFRNWDPFATPFKILVNAMDRYNMLLYKEAQGDYIGDEEKKVMGYVGMATLSIGQAIRDANLTDGFDQLVQLGQDIMDPEAKEDKLMKFIAQKVKLVVPNTVAKVQQLSHPELNDPATIEHTIRGALNPGDPLVPKRYDTFGGLALNDSAWGGLTGIDIFTPRKNADPKRQANLEMIKELTTAKQKTFIMPYSMDGIPGMKGTDLRKEMTKDGKQSWYDRIQQKVNASKVHDTFYRAVTSNKKLSVEARVQAATEILNGYRLKALVELSHEESGISKKRAEAIIMKKLDMKGETDAGAQPY